MAASAVLLRHFGGSFGLPGGGHSYLAVDVFFVLSGFVVAWAYAPRLATTLSPAGFLRLRAIRLLPLIVLGAGVGGVLKIGLLPLPILLGSMAFSMLAVPFVYQGALFVVNGALWSMSYELVSNAAYALGRPYLQTRVLLGLTVLSALGVPLVILKTGSLNVGFMAQGGWAGGVRLAYPFLAGLLIQRLQASGRFSAPPVWAGWLAVAILPILFLPAGPAPIRMAVDALASLVGLPALVWFGLSAKVGPRLAWGCAIAGDISYPLYVIHKPIGEAVGGLVAHGSFAERLAAEGATAAVVIIAAWLAYTLYDVPLRRWLSARITQAPMSAAPVTQPV